LLIALNDPASFAAVAGMMAMARGWAVRYTVPRFSMTRLDAAVTEG